MPSRDESPWHITTVLAVAAVAALTGVLVMSQVSLILR
jgi:hypothetical protein